MMINNFSSIIGGKLISITKISNDTGISRSTLTNLYYKRTHSVKFKTLMKLCDYLQVTLSELIEYIPNGNKK